MLSLSPATRIFVALQPVDLRQSFNGLSARVQSVLAQDPLSGHLFLFTNRNRNRLKAVLLPSGTMGTMTAIFQTFEPMYALPLGMVLVPKPLGPHRMSSSLPAEANVRQSDSRFSQTP